MSVDFDTCEICKNNSYDYTRYCDFGKGVNFLICENCIDELNLKLYDTDDFTDEYIENYLPKYMVKTLEDEDTLCVINKEAKKKMIKQFLGEIKDNIIIILKLLTIKGDLKE